jgi:hypothetical protein
MLTALAIAAAVLGQIALADEENLQTYRIVLDDRGTVYGAYEEIGEQQVRITVDTPWAPGEVISTLRSKVREVHPELKHRRHERRVAQAKEAGFEYVETAAGGFFVPEQVKRLADRSRELAAARVPVDVSFEEASDIALAAGPPPPVDPPSWLRRFGWHAGILVVAAALLALVARSLLSG